MNNFVTPAADTTTSNPAQNPIPKHLETLTTSIFQSLFPSINPQRTPLTSIRRVLLINRERSSSPLDLAAGTGTYTLSLRHYAITTKPIVSLSRGLKRLRAATQFATTRKLKPQPSAAATGKKARSAALPDMSRLDDVADYVLDPSGAGYTSASESEVDTDAEVEVMELKARRVLSRRDREKQQEKPTSEKKEGARSGVQKRAVRLAEIGPRMTLRLVKVEEGLCDGKVMWHEFVTKTKEEQREMERVWETRRSEKEERKRVQKENVERKKKARGKGASSEKEGADEDEDDWSGYDEEMDYGDNFLKEKKETVRERNVVAEEEDEDEESEGEE